MEILIGNINHMKEYFVILTKDILEYIISQEDIG